MQDMDKKLADHLLSSIPGGSEEYIGISCTEVERYSGKWAIRVEFYDEDGDTFGAYLVIEGLQYL